MIGSTLRQYVIVARLGEGGMGVVWRARDTSLERDVALKTLPSDGARDATRRERFFREARAASALNHPNIITVYEINSDRDIDFIAMELVEGETLSARLARGPMPLDDVLNVARQIADAVARAHRAGIVHRDLKPGNVMITLDDLVKVLDFGLAKVDERKTLDERASDETRLVLTRTGIAMGTMGYMSPEQALGDRADARSDVFSFGVILYEMLAGALPFEGRTNTELLRALHFAEPRPLESVRPDVPPSISAIVSKALAKDAKDRFETMGDVAAALKGSAQVMPAVPAEPPQRVRPAAADLDGSTLATAPDGIPSALGRRTGPDRRWPVGVLAWMLIGVAFSAMALVPWGSLLRRDAREAATTTAEASPSQLTLDAAALLERYDRPGNTDRAIEMLQRALRADPGYATAYAQMASAYLAKNAAAPDAQWSRLARENVDRALELNADLSVAHAASGLEHLDGGRLDDARAAFDRALQLDPLNVRALIGIAKRLAALNEVDEADAAFAKAIAAKPEDWRSHLEHGTFLYRRAQFTRAAEAFDAARQRSPDNVLALTNLGASYYMDGRADEAASTLQRALEIRPAGPVYTNLANIRFFQGRYADAAAAFEKAVELDANNSLVWGNLGDAYRWAPGRRADAPAAYARAIQLIDERAASKPLDVNARTRRAVYVAKMGDPRAALADLDRLPDTRALTAQMLVRIATVRELAGDRQGAIEALADALERGYPPKELAADPEFLALRADARYHRMVAGVTDVPRQ